MAPDPAEMASACAVAVHGNFFLSTLESLLLHPSRPVAFQSLEKQVENNLSRSWGKHFTDLCTWFGIATLGISGDSGFPRPTQIYRMVVFGFHLFDNVYEALSSSRPN